MRMTRDAWGWPLVAARLLVLVSLIATGAAQAQATLPTSPSASGVPGPSVASGVSGASGADMPGGAGETGSAAPPPAAPPPAARRWVSVPRVLGRLTSADIGLVINDADPYSRAVGAYYAERRGLAASQVLHVDLPLQPSLDPDTFEALKSRIDRHFGERAQAIAFAWTQPFAVRCHSLTGALALGFDASLCESTCGRSKPSPYFNAAGDRPLRDHGLRLSMLLAAPDVDQAKRLIDRGVAADGTQGLRGALPAVALFVETADRRRNVRSPLFPPPGLQPRASLDVRVVEAPAMAGQERLILVQTGQAQVPGLDTLRWLDGALADHLTSMGGRLDGRGRQTTALDWIASGATASYGNVSEPCNHLQKFPHPQLLLLHYAQGATAIEAYWRSVAWPQQGLFVGEPLAAPFARR